MKVVRQYQGLAPAEKGAVVALGNFDGIHLGHRIVLNAAEREARALGVPLGVIVFEPHPREFFRPDAEDLRLTPLQVKTRLLAKMGVDIVYALPFDTELASKLAPEFVLDVLVDGLGVIHTVAGYDFHFGRNRAGDSAVLGYMGAEEGFGTTIVPPAKEGEQIYSSTFVRECLKHGKPKAAANHLGRPWTVIGRVREGDKRGRTIGFPTANIALDGYLKPALGVYAVRAEILTGPHAGEVLGGVANIGKRPTFDKLDVNLEVHLFDFAEDIYEAEVAVSLVDFIRFEQKFDGIDALKAQIAKDAAAARDKLERSEV